MMTESDRATLARERGFGDGAGARAAYEAIVTEAYRFAISADVVRHYWRLGLSCEEGIAIERAAAQR